MNSNLKYFIGSLLMVLAIMITSCKKDKMNDPAGLLPKVTIDSVHYNHFTKVFCVGSVVDTGSGYVQKFGFCWSKNHDPVVNGTGSSTIFSPYLNYGHFSETAEPLDYGNSYYVRAFAFNKGGYGYSPEIKIQTNPDASTFYLGEWWVYETQTKLSYVVNIARDQNKSENFLITNFAYMGTEFPPAKAIVSGPIISLLSDQTIGNNWIVNGSGTVSENDEIIWNYSINNGNDLIYLIASYSRISK